jgi:hypothetical protein
VTSLQAESAPLPKQRRKHKPKPKRKRKASTRAAERRHGRARRLAERRRLFLLKKLPDDACLSVDQWCALIDVGARTGRRILKSGSGPPTVQLSDRRIAICVGDHRAWLASRTRPQTR